MLTIFNEMTVLSRNVGILACFLTLYSRTHATFRRCQMHPLRPLPCGVSRGRSDDRNHMPNAKKSGSWLRIVLTSSTCSGALP